MIYEQKTGTFTIDDGTRAEGYSGNGEGLNNPAMQAVKGHGPIPQGLYTIAPPHADPVVGPVAMRLEPDPTNEMFGRGDFLIHGDNSEGNFSASEGCIILAHDVRVKIAGHVLEGENKLHVIGEQNDDPA